MVTCIHCDIPLEQTGIGLQAVGIPFGGIIIPETGDKIAIYNCRISGEWHKHEGAE